MKILFVALYAWSVYAFIDALNNMNGNIDIGYFFLASLYGLILIVLNVELIIAYMSKKG